MKTRNYTPPPSPADLFLAARQALRFSYEQLARKSWNVFESLQDQIAERQLASRLHRAQLIAAQELTKTAMKGTSSQAAQPQNELIELDAAIDDEPLQQPRRKAS